MKLLRGTGQRCWVAAVFAALGTSAPGVATASSMAATVSCGATVTHSVTLSVDLNCTGTALIISGQRNSGPITVNLNSHSVVSSNAKVPTIIDGQFAPALTLSGGVVGAPGVRGSILAEAGAGSRYSRLTIYGGGLTATPNSFTTVSHSSFLEGASVATTQNLIHVDGSIFSGVGSSATAIAAPETYLEASGNTITGYRIGIDISGIQSSVDLHTNTITGSGRGIVVDGDGYGGTVGNIYDNIVEHSSSDGIRVGVGGGVGPSSTANTPGLNLIANTSSSNGGSGIQLDASCARTCLYPGLSVEIGGNITENNALLGFRAPVAQVGSSSGSTGTVAVVDIGGEVAGGNGNATQCVNVACSPTLPEVSIAASAVGPWAYTPIQLAARSAIDVGPTDYAIDILDLSTPKSPVVVASCGVGTHCSATITDPPSLDGPAGPFSGQPHVFIAVLAAPNGSDIRAASQPIAVMWTAPTLELSLGAIPPTGPPALLATTNGDVGPTPFAIDVVQVAPPATPAVVAVCGSGARCRYQPPASTTTRSYRAEIANPDGSNVQLASAAVTLPAT